MVLVGLSITFYTKPKCSLCDEVRISLNRLKKEFPLEIEEVNILDDPDLNERYKYEIPVLLSSDLLHFQGRIDEKKVREKLLQILKSFQSPSNREK
jgi:thiol-disulfide isomerase/thioredoxin